MSMLFFKNPVALDREQHRNTHLKPTAIGYSYAKSANAVPLTLSEMAPASLEYPIVFTLNADGTGMPAAVLGIRNNENLFVDAQGNWDADYIPGYVRCYPFALQPTSENGDAIVLLDGGFEGINETEGVDLFDKEGQPAQYLQLTISALEQFHKQERASMEFVAMLNKHGLLVPKMIEITAANNTKIKLDGFHVIEESKLNALGDEVLLELARHGGMGLVYAHLFSFGTMPRLIRRLEPRLAMEKAA
jgi:hypothetical protein